MENVIKIINHTNTDIMVFEKDRFQLAESVDVIQLLPLNEKDDIHTYYKPYWRVIEQ